MSKLWNVYVSWAGWDDDVNGYGYTVAMDTEPEDDDIITIHNHYVANNPELPRGFTETTPFGFWPIGEFKNTDRAIESDRYEIVYRVSPVVVLPVVNNTTK